MNVSRRAFGLILSLFLLLPTVFGQATAIPRQAPVIRLSMYIEGKGRVEATFQLKDGRHWSRFKSAREKPIAGAHLYVDDTGPSFACAVRPQNGTLEPDFSWQGIFAYRDVELRVEGAPGMFLVLEDGTVDVASAPMKLTPAGETYALLSRASWRLRFAVAPSKAAGLSALTYGDVAASHSWKPLRGTYGPTESVWPSVEGKGYPAQFGALYERDVARWRAGIDRIGLQQLGDGNAANIDGLAPSGDEIVIEDGYQRCPQAVLQARWRAARWLDRRGPMYLFDSNGKQLSIDSFPTPVNFATVQKGVLLGRRDLPMFLVTSEGWDNQRYKWLGTPKPNALAFWEHHELATSHLRRLQHNLERTVELSGDAMSQDDMLADFRARQFDFSNRVDQPVKGNGPDDYVPPSLKRNLYLAGLNPHTGNGLDRQFAWIGWEAAELHRLGVRGLKPWLEAWVEVLEKTARADGLVSIGFSPSYMPANVQGVQQFHPNLIMIAYFAVCTQLERDPSDLMSRYCATVFDNPGFKPIGYKWDPTQLGVGWWFAAAIDGVPITPRTEDASGCGKPGWSLDYFGSIEHVLPLLALTYRAHVDKGDLAGAKRWVNVSLRFTKPHPSVAARQAYLKQWSDGNWIMEMRSALDHYEAAHPSQN